MAQVSTRVTYSIVFAPQANFNSKLISMATERSAFSTSLLSSGCLADHKMMVACQSAKNSSWQDSKRDWQ